MDAVTHLAPTVGIVAACDSLAVARASFYRQRPVTGPPASPAPEPPLPSVRPAPARACQGRSERGPLRRRKRVPPWVACLADAERRLWRRAKPARSRLGPFDSGKESGWWESGKPGFWFSSFPIRPRRRSCGPRHFHSSLLCLGYLVRRMWHWRRRLMVGLGFSSFYCS